MKDKIFSGVASEALPRITMQLEKVRGKTLSPARFISDQVYLRMADMPLVSGNSVRLLKDATENYPAWHQAINQAQRTIYFENYFIRDDETGREFAAALAAKARQGVKVRVIYDWFGALGFAPQRFWQRLREAGVEVRCFNPPRLDSPFGLLSRNHRKMISVDGEVTFVVGLCVDKRWLGDQARGLAPWRDTGVEIRGPVVADLELTFAKVWEMAGPPLPPDELSNQATITPAGEAPICAVASAPHSARLYRLDLLVAASAHRSLWITDAYFVPTTPYTQALCAAATNGVDVRLLIPGMSDVHFTRAMMRSGFRPLLEAGVRIYEWRGTMLHAKTAVADRRWSRIGSTNLNLTSWFGNWELDVAVEDEEFAQVMEQMYEDDLANATEIVLGTPVKAAQRAGATLATQNKVSARPRASNFLRVSRIIGMIITNQLGLNPSEALILAIAGLLVLASLVIVAFWPWVLAGPLIAIGGWIGLALLIRAYKLFSTGKRQAELRSVGGSLQSAGKEARPGRVRNL
jgi:cardiolipin synthase